MDANLRLSTKYNLVNSDSVNDDEKLKKKELIDLKWIKQINDLLARLVFVQHPLFEKYGRFGKNYLVLRLLRIYEDRKKDLTKISPKNERIVNWDDLFSFLREELKIFNSFPSIDFDPKFIEMTYDSFMKELPHLQKQGKLNLIDRIVLFEFWHLYCYLGYYYTWQYRKVNSKKSADLGNIYDSFISRNEKDIFKNFTKNYFSNREELITITPSQFTAILNGFEEKSFLLGMEYYLKTPFTKINNVKRRENITQVHEKYAYQLNSYSKANFNELHERDYSYVSRLYFRLKIQEKMFQHVAFYSSFLDKLSLPNDFIDYMGNSVDRINTTKVEIEQMLKTARSKNGMNSEEVLNPLFDNSFEEMSNILLKEYEEKILQMYDERISRLFVPSDFKNTFIKDKKAEFKTKFTKHEKVAKEYLSTYLKIHALDEIIELIVSPNDLDDQHLRREFSLFSKEKERMESHSYFDQIVHNYKSVEFVKDGKSFQLSYDTTMGSFHIYLLEGDDLIEKHYKRQSSVESFLNSHGVTDHQIPFLNLERIFETQQDSIKITISKLNIFSRMNDQFLIPLSLSEKVFKIFKKKYF